MVKYIKISQNNCRPCGDLDNLIKMIAPDKLDKLKPITSIDEMTEDGVMYTVKVDEYPEFGAKYDLMSVPVLIELNDDNTSAKTIYKPIAQDIEYIFNTL